MLNYPLHLFHAKSNLKKVKKACEKLINEFLEKIDKKDKIKFHRGFIEDFFKLLKEGLGFKQLNRFTLNSMSKYTSIVVLLGGIITYLRINSKTDFQSFQKVNFTRPLKNINIQLYNLIRTIYNIYTLWFEKCKSLIFMH